MKYKKWLISLGILLSICIFMGISYAYYIKSYSQENSNIVKTKCLNLSITNEKNDIKLDEQYPIPDSEGKKLTPYQFTITNTCEQFISYNVNLEALEGTTMDSNAIKVMVNNEAPANLATLDTTQTSINNSVESRTLVTGSLGSGDSIDYAIRLWMDYGDSADLSSMNKVFNSKVVVTATIGTYKPSDYVSTLHDAILVNEYGVTDLDNAIKKIEAKGTPDLSKTAPIIEWQEASFEQSYNTSVIKPAETSLNIDKQTSSLTEKDTLMTVFTKKEYNSSTGYYSLSNAIKVDPTTLEFNGNTEYYYQYEATIYDYTNDKLGSSVSYGDTEIYKIIGASKEKTNTTWNKKNYDSITYKLTVKRLGGQGITSDKSDKGLYATNDDKGVSYYYRGAVLNNNVYFGGYYWKIVRINGDGSIRLLYNGKDTSINNTIIGRSQFNTSYNLPLYEGYMYGKNSTTREETIKNEVSSTIKEKVDSWYEENILNNNLEKYLTDSGYCGDRSIYSGNGYDTENTYYASYKRYKDNNPTLICPDNNDLYTLASATFGNKSLKYPIGLITYDEVSFAGNNYSNLNKLSWIYSNDTFYTMTPSYFYKSDNTARVWQLRVVGNLYHWTGVDVSQGIRPVINLKANVEITGGIGTINNPYIIKS